MKKNIIKFIIVALLLGFYLLLSYFNSFYFHAKGYGSGDAYMVMLNAYTIKTGHADYFLVSYFYRILFEITGITYYQLSFYFTPIVGLLVLVILYKLLRSRVGFSNSILGILLVIFNTWLSYMVTEPSKELFVLVFLLLSFYCLFKTQTAKLNTWLVLSFIFFGIGNLYYYSILIFFPYYLLVMVFLIIRKNHNGPILFQLSKILVSFFFILAIFLFPFLLSKSVLGSSSEPESLINNKTETFKQGIFKRQINSMIFAVIEDRQQLGFSTLHSGIMQYLSEKNEFIIIYLVVLMSSCILFFRRNNFIIIFFTAAAIYTYIVIGLQWKSYSHTSRYPSYIVYFLLISVSFSLMWLFNTIKNLKIKIIILGSLITYLVSSSFQRVDKYREIYYPHLAIVDIAKSVNIQINHDNQVIYLGWPSITLALLEGYKLQNTDYLHTFGWDSINLNSLTSYEYIVQKNIKYFIYNGRGSDYYDSNNIVFNLLQLNFKLIRIKESDPLLVIYKIERISS